MEPLLLNTQVIFCQSFHDIFQELNCSLSTCCPDDLQTWKWLAWRVMLLSSWVAESPWHHGDLQLQVLQRIFSRIHTIVNRFQSWNNWNLHAETKIYLLGPSVQTIASCLGRAELTYTNLNSLPKKRMSYQKHEVQKSIDNCTIRAWK